MSKFRVGSDKEQLLHARMLRLGILEEDIDERFIRGSGAGGQKINKTSSCVQLLHRPSGIEVRCQEGRSQALNRFLARRELCDRIESKIHGIKSEAQKAAHKIRKQKQRRSRKAKNRMLEDKAHRGAIKRQRGGSFD